MDSLKKSINKTIKFTLDFIESKFSAHIYEQRALLLKSLNFYTLSIEKETSICTYKINVCEDAAITWKICLNNEPSVYNTYFCNSCDQCTFMTSVLKVDPKIIINHGFKALNRAVVFCKTLKKVKCRKENCFKLCTVTAYPNFHIFIALDVIDKNNKCIECCLEDLPITLNLDMVDKYRLAGIIGSYHNYKVAYCLRSDNNWELYDGYSRSIEVVDESTTIQPLGAIYILE
ncbi:uncharacterized protein LOC130677679 [Microplitis mediator]|uniref:uncharacterized protein LOC130677679 n=1 Tax=Microplitis mediator TaxID=375433 RepID=UPI002553B8DD|nr:uncharacterized protein LOC130677679 [Microplitis mediator]